jgi:D-alanyl-D-alanine dipeptidase
MKNELVNVADYGMNGINYYYTRRDKFGLSLKELSAVGVTNNSAYVDKSIIPALQKVREELLKKGYDIIVKDAYRSPELYKLVQRKRYERDGKENTDKTFNAIAMPHASGLAVDINLVDPKTGTEVKMWDKTDWPDGAKIDFYKDRTDAKGKTYHRLQTLLIETMLKNGFALGGLREFWHFNYAQD